MKGNETVAPVAAALAAVSALVCCVPIGFTTAAATASLGVAIAPYQPWLLCASIVLLAVGGFQLRRARRLCATRPTLSIVVFCLAAAVVLAVVFFPQAVAGLAADWLP